MGRHKKLNKNKSVSANVWMAVVSLPFSFLRWLCAFIFFAFYAHRYTVSNERFAMYRSEEEVVNT